MVASSPWIHLEPVEGANDLPGQCMINKNFRRVIDLVGQLIEYCRTEPPHNLAYNLVGSNSPLVGCSGHAQSLAVHAAHTSFSNKTFTKLLEKQIHPESKAESQSNLVE